MGLPAFKEHQPAGTVLRLLHFVAFGFPVSHAPGPESLSSTALNPKP